MVVWGGIDGDGTAEALANAAATARIRFRGASAQQRREVLATVLSNATLRDQETVGLPAKNPFDVLEEDSEGALRAEEWAILDLNQ